jgi:HTH-type transcriptional regulator / antitoxin HipB
VVDVQRRSLAPSKAAELGSALSAARRRAGLSQAELGEFAGGIDRHFVAALEHGEVTTQLLRLIQLLDVVGLELVVRPVAGSPLRGER